MVIAPTTPITVTTAKLTTSVEIIAFMEILLAVLMTVLTPTFAVFLTFDTFDTELVDFAICEEGYVGL